MRYIVFTGGPGAGKSAVLELVRRSLCRHVVALPEAATIVFGGGFPRHEDTACRGAAQRAIFAVQGALEEVAAAHHPAIVLCDRGSVDGAAYWPGPADFWSAMGTTRDEQLARYATVIHLRSPAAGAGFDHSNPLRTETASTAAALDDAVLGVWTGHPDRHVVPAEADFARQGGAGTGGRAWPRARMLRPAPSRVHAPGRSPTAVPLLAGRWRHFVNTPPGRRASGASRVSTRRCRGTRGTRGAEGAEALLEASVASTAGVPAGGTSRRDTVHPARAVGEDVSAAPRVTGVGTPCAAFRGAASARGVEPVRCPPARASVDAVGWK